MSFILDALRRAEQERKAGSTPDLDAMVQPLAAPPRQLRPAWLLTAGALAAAGGLAVLFAWHPWLPARTSPTAAGAPDDTVAIGIASQNEPIAAQPPSPERRPPGEPGPTPAPAAITASPAPPPASPPATASRAEPPKTTPARQGAIASLPRGSNADGAPHPGPSPLAPAQQAPAQQPPRHTATSPPPATATQARSTRETAATPQQPAAAAAPAPAAETTTAPVPTTPTAANAAAAPAPTAPAAATAPAKVLPVADLPPEQRQPFAGLRLDAHVYSGTASQRFILVRMKSYRVGDTLGKNGPVLEDITPEGAILRAGKVRALLPHP